MSSPTPEHRPATRQRRVRQRGRAAARSRAQAGKGGRRPVHERQRAARGAKKGTCIVSPVLGGELAVCRGRGGPRCRGDRGRCGFCRALRRGCGGRAFLRTSWTSSMMATESMPRVAMTVSGFRSGRRRLSTSKAACLNISTTSIRSAISLILRTASAPRDGRGRPGTTPGAAPAPGAHCRCVPRGRGCRSGTARGSCAAAACPRTSSAAFGATSTTSATASWNSSLTLETISALTAAVLRRATPPPPRSPSEARPGRVNTTALPLRTPWMSSTSHSIRCG